MPLYLILDNTIHDAAKYDDYHISQRLAKFYTACGRPDEAKASAVMRPVVA